ncbi:hypothetical protein GS601_19365 [Myxacorys almedinensis A]|uniref:Uncharacterized protein n=2 Tax=Myxacorys TaxID=2056239 RepID=A0A8J7Z459_9CYAN|nr:hypothetical protein [Myxacorys almedinensis A]
MYRTAFNEVMNSFAFTKAEPSSTAKESFIVRGNEPFWNVTVNKSNIVYSTPETPKLTFPSVAPLGAEGRPADNVRVYRLQGQPSGFLIINKGACSDTMSDQAYAYSATLILGNVVREGCAVKQ